MIKNLFKNPVVRLASTLVLSGAFACTPLITFAATPSPNLIANPQLEVATVSSTSPDNWSNGGFGTNDRAFSYVPGQTGKGVSVLISTYTDGDAKWVPLASSTVSTDAGALYTFSDSYNSNVSSFIVVGYTYPTPENSRFIEITTLPSTGGVWKETTQQFSSILSVSGETPTSIVVYHAIRAVGQLTTDNYQLIQSLSQSQNQFSQGLISLTFDDGWASQFDSAFPKMQTLGLRGTFYVISNALLGSSHELFADAAATVNMLTTVASSSVTWAPLFTDPSAQTYFFTDTYTSTEVSTVTVTYSESNHTGTTTLQFGPFAAGTDAFASFTLTLPVGIDAGISISHGALSGDLTVQNQKITAIANKYFSPAQMLLMQQAGNEIGGHTANHCHIVQVNAGNNASCALLGPSQTTSFTNEVDTSLATILSLGATSVKSFAYPYGGYNSEVIGLLQAAGYQNARSVDIGYNTKVSNQLALKVQIIDKTTTFNLAKLWIDTARLNKFWLILVFHQIDSLPNINNNGEDGGTTPETFQEIVDYLATQPSGTIKTVAEVMALNEMGGTVPSVPDITPPVITLTGAQTVPLTVNSNYIELGATATDNIDPSVTVTINNSTVNTAVVGTYTVTYNATDVAGNNATEVTRTVNVSAPVIIPPSGGGGGGGGGSVYYNTTFKVNSGAPQSTSTNVTLTTNSSGLSQMWISNDALFSTGSWIPAQNTYPWILTTGDGLKTVYAKFGNASTTYATNQATITLSGTGSTSTAPVVTGTSTGTVLGTSTSCSVLLTTYMKKGGVNNKDEVKKLQQFLNTTIGSTLPITGFFGSMTKTAVMKFQATYKAIVALPYISAGYPDANVVTGNVFKTTQWTINNMACPSLNLPMPIIK